MRPNTSPSARGLAALTIVMVLFLIMAMVAAYTNRNLIFEQRTAANSYRAERALVAADSAVDWALSMLNGGLINDDCELDDTATTDYRDRYLSADRDGGVTAVKGTGNVELYSGCINVDGVLQCGCPTPNAPTVNVFSTAEPPGNAFRVRYFQPGVLPAAGVVSLDVLGCGTPGSEASACVSPVSGPSVDGVARVRVAVGLLRAIPSAPLAALTAATAINAGTNELRLSNPDALTGFTTHTGAVGTAAATSRYVPPAGSGGDGRFEGDALLFNRRLQVLGAGGTAADTMFESTFGMSAPAYSLQQGVVRRVCTAACGMDDLDYMLRVFPGRTLWFAGNLTLTGTTTLPSGSIGSNAKPAMVIVTRRLTLQSPSPMIGLFYGSAVNWENANTSLRGALISASDFIATTNVSITYDAAVINTLVTSYGTFVRTPGSWTRPTF